MLKLNLEENNKVGLNEVLLSSFRQNSQASVVFKSVQFHAGAEPIKVRSHVFISAAGKNKGCMSRHRKNDIALSRVDCGCSSGA